MAEDKLHAPAWDHTVEAQFGGKTYRRGAGMTDVSIFRADDHTVLIGTDPLLRKALNNHSSPQDGAMSKLLRRVKSPPNVMAIVLMEPLRPLMAMPMAMVKWPPQLADVPKVPDLVTSVGLKVNLTSGPSVLLAIRANDEASAQELEKTIDKLLAAAREQMAAQTARGFRSSDPVDQASGQVRAAGDRADVAVGPPGAEGKQPHPDRRLGQEPPGHVGCRAGAGGGGVLAHGGEAAGDPRADAGAPSGRITGGARARATVAPASSPQKVVGARRVSPPALVDQTPFPMKRGRSCFGNNAGQCFGCWSWQ